MKELTPMSRYKTGLATLRYKMSAYSDELLLNKAQSKSIPYPFDRYGKGSTKGVESDFILIFKDKQNKEVSFALIFDYIDKTPDQQMVFGSIKFGVNDGELKTGAPMNLDTFKNTLNAFNKDIQNMKDKSFDKLMTAFSVAFMKEEFNLKEELNTATSSVTQFLQSKTKELNINQLETLANDSKDLHKKAEQTVDKRLKATKIYKEREELRRRVEELNKLIDEKRASLEEEERVNEKKKMAKTADKTLDAAKQKLDDSVEKELKKYPAAVKSRLKI